MIILNVNAYYQCANVSIIFQSATFNASKTSISRYFFTSTPSNPQNHHSSSPQNADNVSRKCPDETICQMHIAGLTSVTIPNSVTAIGGYAFQGCTKLTKLVSLAVVPPVCSGSAFKNVDKTICRLLVPEGSVNKYKAADQWKEFLNISKYDGVDDVSVDTQNAVYEVYNLQGVRVGSGMHEAEVTADVLPHGVYILVSPQGRKKLKI